MRIHLSFLVAGYFRWVALVLLSASLTNWQAHAQAPAWQAVSATNAALGTASSIIQYTAADAVGNIIVGGTFTGTCTLGGTTLTSTGQHDLFVAKWSPASNSYLWVQQAGSAQEDYLYGLAVSGLNVYLAGQFRGTAASFGSINLRNSSVAPFDTDGFVAKITDAGSTSSFGWAQLIGGTDNELVESLAVSGSNVYVGGDFGSPVLMLGGGSLSTNASGDDGFVAKFTDGGSSPTFRWVLGCGSVVDSGSIGFYGLAVQGNTVYAAGLLANTVSVGGVSLTSVGRYDVVAARINDAGSIAYFTGGVRAGGSGNENVNGLIATSNGIYVSGFSASASSTWGSTALNSLGGMDGFVAKLIDTDGVLSFSWARLLGGPGADRTYNLAANGNNVYATGLFTGPATFDTTTLAGAGGTDGYVVKLTDAGTSSSVAWVQQSGGAGNDVNYAVALSGTGVYVGGSVTPVASFGALLVTSPVGTTTATLAELADPTILATTTAAARPISSLVIYPNPAHGSVTVQIGAKNDKYVLTLQDALGREVRCYLPPASSATTTTLSLLGLPAGLYVLRNGPNSQKLQVY